MMKAHLIQVLSLTTVLLVTGCNGSEPTPTPPPVKQPAAPAPAQAPALPPGHPDIGMSAQTLPPGTVAEAANPQWTVPKDWQAGKPSAMRKATFLAKGSDGQSAEIVVSAFPGDVGGLAANINRWRGQIGLGPVAADEVAGMTSAQEINGTKVTVVDFKGATPPAGKTQAQRMIVVTIPHGGNSWFIKITGDVPLVEAQREAFLEFVKSVKF